MQRSNGKKGSLTWNCSDNFNGDYTCCPWSMLSVSLKCMGNPEYPRSSSRWASWSPWIDHSRLTSRSIMDDQSAWNKSVPLANDFCLNSICSKKEIKLLNMAQSQFKNSKFSKQYTWLQFAKLDFPKWIHKTKKFKYWYTAYQRANNF